MPNDLGQPLNGMIRNNCRLEYYVHRKTPRVVGGVGVSLQPAEAAQTLYSIVSFLAIIG